MKFRAVTLFMAVLCCALDLVHGAEAAATAWSDRLGSEDPAVWKKAEADLQAEGAAAQGALTRLAENPDPWVAARAERLLMALRGIDPRLPRNIQLSLLGYPDLGAAARAELLDTLSRPGPGHLGALIFLIGQPQTEGEGWNQRLRNAIAQNPADVELIKPESVPPATLGLLFSCFPDHPQGAKEERYAKWRALNPDIRFHIRRDQVELEIGRFRENAETAELLSYLPRVRDAEARIHAARFSRGLIMADKKLAPDSLDENASIGHLLVLSSDSSAVEWYAKHLARHPGIADSLLPELTSLTIRHLLAQRDLEKAILLFLAPQDETWHVRTVDWNLLREIGAALGSDPAALPDGLPEINNPSRFPIMGSILDAWFKANRENNDNAAPGGKTECFDRWAKTDEWLEAAHRHGALDLYQRLMIRRGKFTETLILHESDRNHYALMNLGELLVSQPKLVPLVPAGKCTVETLRSLLHGAISSYESAWRESKPQPSFGMAAAWLETHPNLLEKDSFSTAPLYQAALDWKAGRRAQAAAALLATTKPIITEFGGRTHSNPNPIASHAIAMLADLLAASPDADLQALLPAETATRENLTFILERLGKRKSHAPADIRMSLALTALIRERFDPEGILFAIDAYKGRRISLDAWMAGDENLAGDILIASFLSNPDKEEQYDGGSAWAIALLGRAGEAMEKLDSAKASLAAPVYRSKRARLLQVLGRTKEAMETVSPEHQPNLRLALALETGEWDAAASASAAAYDEMSATAAARSCIDTLSGDPDRVKRHINSNLGTIRLLNGDSLREDDLVEMARDSEVAADFERILAAALASGTDVPYLQLSQYLQYPDLLPDKPRAIQLAAEAAARDTVIINGEPVTGVHKMVIAASLLNLGRGDLAYAAVRPLFASSLREKPAVPLKRSYGWGYTPPLYEAFNAILRLTQMEWPDLPAEKQMGKLDAILSHGDPSLRARNMLGLISKHHLQLNKKELHELLWLPLFDLSHAGKVPQEMKDRALALMDSKQPDANDRKRLANAWTPEIWFMESHHPPGGTGMRYEFGYTPKAGKKHAPRGKDFVLIDGLDAALKLIAKGERDAAAKLIRECVIRNLLDPGLTEQRVHWNSKEGSGWGSGRGHISGGSSTLVSFFEAYDLPPEICIPLIRACTDTWNNTSDDNRYLNAANYLAANGRQGDALGLYHRFLVASSGVTGSGIAGRPHVRNFLKTRGLLAAQRGDGAAAVHDIGRLVQLAPYEPESAAAIIAALTEGGDQKSLDAARDVTDRFWRVRLIEIPTSRTYAHWRKQWENLFP
ncbi:hypothetical protein HZ994_14850 [Akkermansiaceae bacterium]|nr:hypothetical protein HZ994_14850 [Akkermansiaceae bacterium]